MAFADALAVRNSDLYEYKNTAKPLLTLIYQLIERAEEDEEPTENEGTAWASQGYLAAQLGCSESQVSKWVQVFVNDAWLIATAYRDEFGHPRYRYSLPDNALTLLEKRKMKKEGRRYARKTQASKRRPQCYRNIAQELLDEDAHASATCVPRESLTARSPGVLPLGAAQPTRSEGHPLPLRADIGVGVVRSVSSSVCEKPADKASLTSFDIDQEQQPPHRGFASSTTRGATPTPRDPSGTLREGMIKQTPPVPPPPVDHFSHNWVAHTMTDRKSGKPHDWETCVFCTTTRGSENSRRPCRPASDMKEEAARWLELQSESQGAGV